MKATFRSHLTQPFYAREQYGKKKAIEDIERLSQQLKALSLKTHFSLGEANEKLRLINAIFDQITQKFTELGKNHPLSGLDLATNQEVKSSAKSTLDPLDLSLAQRSNANVIFFFKPNSDPYLNPNELFLNPDVLASILNIDKKFASLEQRIEFLKAPYEIASDPPSSFKTLPQETLFTIPKKTPLFFESCQPRLDGEINFKKGGYGKVCKVLFENSEFALKRAKDPNRKFREALKQEAFIYMLLGYHPNIAEIEAIGSEKLFIKFEPNGTLSECFEQRRPLTKGEILQISLDIASALRFLHEKKINYKDLKPNNILISKHPTFKALLFDFGISQRSSVDHLRNIRSEYAAPEVADERGHFLLTNKIDIWAFGIFLFETITNSHPFEDLNPYEGFQYLPKLRELLLTQKKESLPDASKTEFMSDSDRKLISIARSCLAITPAKRPTMDEIILKLSEIKI